MVEKKKEAEELKKGGKIALSLSIDAGIAGRAISRWGKQWIGRILEEDLRVRLKKEELRNRVERDYRSDVKSKEG